MNKKNLETIDKEILALLKERLSLIEGKNTVSLEQQIATIKQLDEPTAVPEFIWQNVVTSCAAAARKPVLKTTLSEAKNITLVGGKGMMGQFFAEEFRNQGYKVQSLGSKDWDAAEQLLGEADFVLVCVPIERTLDVIEKTAKYLKNSAVLADITSIKTPFVEAMLKHHSGPVLGLHPMFGPGVHSFLSQTVVACPGRRNEESQWVLEFIKNMGAKLIVCSPQEHDEMMIAVQAIRHFSTFSLGVFLAEEKINLSRSLEFSSPIYRLGIDLVSRLFAQDASLYVDIMLATPERCLAIDRLAKTVNRLAQLVLEKNRDALLEEFQQTQATFGQEADRAMEESNYFLNALTTLLAAQTLPAPDS